MAAAHYRDSPTINGLRREWNGSRSDEVAGACSALTRCPLAYTESVLRQLSVKAAPITIRVADYGPVVPACCNVCRTCTTTNLIGAVFGAVAFVGLGAKRLATRFSAKPS